MRVPYLACVTRRTIQLPGPRVFCTVEGLTGAAVMVMACLVVTAFFVGPVTGQTNSPAVTIADASAAEGDAITFTVTLDRAVSGGLTVTPGFSGGTAAKGTDYTANTAALTFTGTANEKKTFTVSTTEDEVVETDETFTVSLSVSGTTRRRSRRPTRPPANHHQRRQRDGHGCGPYPAPRAARASASPQTATSTPRWPRVRP